MAYGYIYEITNTINGKKYIGKRETFKDVKTYMGSGILLKAAIEKYGIENFTKRILNEYDDKESLCEAEKYFISVYRHFYGDKMYNISNGGDGFSGKHSEDTKKKISDSHKKLSEKEKRRIYEPRKKSIYQYDLDGNFIRSFNSMMDAERETSINNGHISKCCNGKRKTAGGYIWKFK